MYCDVLEIVFIGIFPNVAAVVIHVLESKITIFNRLSLRNVELKHTDSYFRMIVPSTDTNAAV